MIGTFTIDCSGNMLYCLCQLTLDKQRMEVSWHWHHQPSPEEIQVVNQEAEPFFQDALKRLQLAAGAYLN